MTINLENADGHWLKPTNEEAVLVKEMNFTTIGNPSKVDGYIYLNIKMFVHHRQKFWKRRLSVIWPYYYLDFFYKKYNFLGGGVAQY